MQPQLDPASGDYTGTRTADVGNAVWLRLLTPLGSWWADATLGSRLHELTREKDLPRVTLLAEQYARDALQPLLDDGRATSVGVSAVRLGGRLGLHVTVTDAGGAVTSYDYTRVL